MHIYVSVVQFYDWNGQRLDVSSGARFRPPVIMSSGPSLLIRFYANGGTGLGYKAFYSFVIGHSLDKSVKPITDCGGYVENLGGAITMMDMVGEGVKTYDCVWLIRPPKNFLHLKTHMYLKVVTFADMGERVSFSSSFPSRRCYHSDDFSREYGTDSEARANLGPLAARNFETSGHSSSTA